MRKAQARPALVLALLLALTGPVLGPASAQTTTSAEMALAAGDVALARRLAQERLASAPGDAAALSVLAAADLAQNRPASARRHARAAHATGTTAHDRFVAARMAAAAAHGEGRTLVAQYWLRRALQTAPHPAAKAVTIQDYRNLRRVAPLNLAVDLAFRPSANVNGGAENPMLSIDGVPTFFVFDGASRALPGAEARLGFALRYRVAGDAARGTEIGATFSQTSVWLSDRAKAIAPEARGSDFASAVLDLHLTRHAELTERTAVRGGVQLGQSWLGGAAYARRARADVTVLHLLSPRTMGRFGLALERHWRLGGHPPATAVVLDGGLERRLHSGAVLGLRLTAGQTVSGDANSENQTLAGEVRYSLGKPVAGVAVSASLGLAWRDYPVFFGGVFGDSGREDRSVAGSLDLALGRLQAFGFEPVISLEGRRTRSNVSRYDGTSLGIGLRIRSSF